MATESREPWYGTWYGALAILAVAIAFYISFRAVVFDWYRTPSGSMSPTLRTNDIFFVSKLAYRDALPQRGDMIVYRAPEGLNLVKRVIGLPGDAVVYDGRDEHLTINGVAASLEVLADYEGDPGSQIVRETIGNHSHFVLRRRGFQTPGGTYDVPDEHYFVLGDNRDNSLDSRYPDHGFVPREAIVGKVGFIWHLADEPPGIPTSQPASESGSTDLPR